MVIGLAGAGAFKNISIKVGLELNGTLTGHTALLPWFIGYAGVNLFDLYIHDHLVLLSNNHNLIMYYIRIERWHMDLDFMLENMTLFNSNILDIFNYLKNKLNTCETGIL